MSYFYVSCYGEVQPCPFVPVQFGNIRDESLESILSRMWSHKAFRGMNDKCLGCNLSPADLEAGAESNGYPCQVNGGKNSGD